MGSRRVSPTLVLVLVLGAAGVSPTAQSGERSSPPVASAVSLVATHSGKCLDVENRGTHNGARLQQWDCNDSPQQTFWLSPIGAYVRIVGFDGKAVDVFNESLANGGPVGQWENGDFANQQWKLTEVGDGEYVIANRRSRKVLDVAGGQAEVRNGAGIQQWDYVGGANQRWRLRHQPAGRPTGIYTIVAAHSGRCLDVVNGWIGNGVRLQQWDCNGFPQQAFWIAPLGGDLYRILTHTGRALDVTNASPDNGAPIQQWEYLGGVNQIWRIAASPGGDYTISAVHSNKVLDVAGGPSATANGVPLQQWDDVGGANQRWRLYAKEPRAALRAQIAVGADNTPPLPKPATAFDRLPAESDYLVTDVVPLQTFSPFVTAAPSVMGQLTNTTAYYWLSHQIAFVAGYRAIVPRPLLGWRCSGFNTGCIYVPCPQNPGLMCIDAAERRLTTPPVIAQLPSLRRRVFWKQQGLASGLPGQITVTNGQSIGLTYTYKTGKTTSDEQTEQFAASIGKGGAGKVLEWLTATFTATFSRRHTEQVTVESTMTESVSCAAPAGRSRVCAFWVLYEVYDVVGSDGAPWWDPFHQAGVPAFERATAFRLYDSSDF